PACRCGGGRLRPRDRGQRCRRSAHGAPPTKPQASAGSWNCLSSGFRHIGVNRCCARRFRSLNAGADHPRSGAARGGRIAMTHARNDHEAQRQRLIEIVVGMIEERGSAALSPAEIAARAGMATANLQRYFESREALIEAVAEYWFQPKVAIM